MLFRRVVNQRTAYILRHCSNGSSGSSNVPKNPTKCTGSSQTSPIQDKDTFSRFGDSGTSKTLTGKSLNKDNELFHAIGATEELLSFLGLAREHAQESEHEYADKLKRIQTLVIDISTAISRAGDKSCQLIEAVHTKELEDWIKKYAKELPPPEQYIVPGGGVTSASLHVARSICRRTERVITPLVREGNVDAEILIYLNRLGDFLFTISRIAAKLDKRTEIIYIPKPDHKVQAQ